MSPSTSAEVIDLLTAAEQIANGLADLARSIYDLDPRWKNQLAAANAASVQMQETRQEAEAIPEVYDETEADTRTLTRKPMGLVGRGSFLLQQFADDLSRSFGGPPMGKAKRARLNRNSISKLTKSHEGGHFDVSIVGDDGPTGYIARVTISYAGFDEEEAKRR